MATLLSPISTLYQPAYSCYFAMPRQATKFLGNYTPKVAVFAHPTDAAGTNGDFEGETTSIVASFDFHPLKTRELGQIPAR